MIFSSFKYSYFESKTQNLQVYLFIEKENKHEICGFYFHKQIISLEQVNFLFCYGILQFHLVEHYFVF